MGPEGRALRDVALGVRNHAGWECSLGYWKSCCRSKGLSKLCCPHPSLCVTQTSPMGKSQIRKRTVLPGVRRTACGKHWPDTGPPARDGRAAHRMTQKRVLW